MSRVKRKPVPPLNYYPPPDPTDPFAPLWVLRNRSSTLLTSREDVSVLSHATSFTLYPDVPTVDVATPLPTRRVSPQSHYRRRSQSFAIEEQSSKFLLKKDSFASLNSVKPKRSRKISTSSISGPAPLPINAELPPKLQPEHAIRTLTALDSTLYPPRRPIRTFDLKPAPELASGFCSEPETLSRKAISAPKRSSMMIPTPTSSNHSHSSSYINISAPSSEQSLCQDDKPHSLFPFRRAIKQHTHSVNTQPEWELPTQSQLAHASTLPVISQSGIRVPFGSLFANQRTIVVFIRHFWCPLSQDYMTSLTSLVDPSQMVIKDTIQPIDLVVIGNGSHTLIPKYKNIFGLKYDMYVDPDLKVYEALGMMSGLGKDRGVPIKGITMVVLRALRVGMPVWEKGGDVRQLGGEFVLGPGLRSVYAHRMQTPKGHAPILDVLNAAGTAFPPPPSRHRRAAKIRSRSVFDIPSVSDFETSPPKKIIKQRIPKLIRTSATWDGGLSSTIPAGEYTIKRQSVCGTLAADVDRRSLSLTVSVSVPGNTDEDNDLVVLFQDRGRDDLVHAYASP